MGQNFSVPLGYELKSTDTLKWKFKETVVFYKKSGILIIGKEDDINANGSLQLTNLKKDQTGVYTPQVFDQTGRKQATKKTHLYILDPVKKPKVNATCKDKTVVFTCVSNKQPNTAEYEWLLNGDTMKKEKGLSLEVYATETEADRFACKVFNKASSETSEYVIHTCSICDQFAAMGQNFSVPLGYELKSTDTLKWKFKETVVFYKKSGIVIIGKKDDINANGSLQLTDLKKNQAGVYTPQVFDQTGRKQATKKTHLYILDPVNKPTIHITCKDIKVIFTCLSDKKSSDLEYEWLQNGNKLEKEQDSTLGMNAAETKADKFACKIFNHASSETSEAVTHKCSGVSGMKISVYNGCKLGFILVLIITAIVRCVRTERTSNIRLKAEEELPLEQIKASSPSSS
ncbi:T-lymphocyte surface antigen Ly-9-like [Cyprinodon tularosa]|uniref:T-lymphocyte surface antigen Ly-9-like n=1 Tax=Cyprinodon tularosa TaxID=77115 RepID=UPI0018E28CE3|nr:T-lymphocyte surface antigen Ly-9-like [Cyprinodon tularosa]